jgi:two-component system, response regulator, stage 0 sporulation protein F
MSSKTSMLYVDDEPINLVVFEAMFKRKYIVFKADSGMAGLKILEDNPIDVVISDMRMPRMNGLEFIKRARETFPQIIYCILSGYELTDEIQSAIDNQTIHTYFQKPFKMDEIDLTIKDLLSR